MQYPWLEEVGGEGRVGAVVTGRVTQGGQPRAGATVAIFGGLRANRLKRLGAVRTSASGAFTFRARTGVFFQANVAAAAGAAPAVCSAIGPAIAPMPCVNPTLERVHGREPGHPQTVYPGWGRGRARFPAPTLRLMPATVRLGTCSFADEGLLKHWYPRGVSSPKARLGYYAERFDTVEVDSPFYHLPDPEVTGRWAQRTPPEFIFHVKATRR